jgi:hypothetical protein
MTPHPDPPHTHETRVDTLNLTTGEQVPLADLPARARKRLERAIQAGADSGDFYVRDQWFGWQRVKRRPSDN